jgi:hypothetical protein
MDKKKKGTLKENVSTVIKEVETIGEKERRKRSE